MQALHVFFGTYLSSFLLLFIVLANGAEPASSHPSPAEIGDVGRNAMTCEDEKDDQDSGKLNVKLNSVQSLAVIHFLRYEAGGGRHTCGKSLLPHQLSYPLSIVQDFCRGLYLDRPRRLGKCTACVTGAGGMRRLPLVVWLPKGRER